MTLVILSFVLPSVHGQTSATCNEVTECNDHGWVLTPERILDFHTLDVNAHQAALEKLSNSKPLQDLISTHAIVNRSLDETVYLLSQFDCSMRAYAITESEGSRNELLDQIPTLKQQVKVLLDGMIELDQRF